MSTTDEDLAALAPSPTVHEALVALIDSLPPIGKDETMSGREAYSYRSVEAIVGLIKERAGQFGIHWAPHCVDRISDESYPSQSGKTTMRRVVLGVEWRIYGPSGDWIKAESQGEASDSSDKATNKASTAALKVMLLALLQIADAVDPDHDRPDNGGQAPPWGTVRQVKSTILARIVETQDGIDPAEARRIAGDVWKAVAAEVGMDPVEAGNEEPVSTDAAERLLGNGGLVTVALADAFTPDDQRPFE